MKNVVVSIFSSVVEELSKSAFKEAPNENGGVLVGTRSIAENILTYNIVGALAVSEFEEFRSIYKATPTEFTCTDRLGWANLALKAVESYGASYIGDWHSHPNMNSSMLSPRDITMIIEQFILGQFDPFPPIHLIVSWSSSGQEINVKASLMLHEQVVIVVDPIIVGSRSQDD